MKAIEDLDVIYPWITSLCCTRVKNPTPIQEWVELYNSNMSFISFSGSYLCLCLYSDKLEAHVLDKEYKYFEPYLSYLVISVEIYHCTLIFFNVIVICFL